jgi:hypothetical protein
VPRIDFVALVGLVAVAGVLRGGGDRAKHVLLRPMAEDAGIPMIRVTGAYETMNRVAQLVGAPLGGLLIYWFGTQGAIWLDAVSFAACAALLATFVNPKADVGPADQQAPREPYLAALRRGARHLIGDRLLFGMTAALFVINALTLVSLQWYRYGESNRPRAQQRSAQGCE